MSVEKGECVNRCVDKKKEVCKRCAGKTKSVFVGKNTSVGEWVSVLRV